MTLTAPWKVSVGVVDYAFLNWQVNGTDQAADLASVTISMNDNTTAVAVYSTLSYVLTVTSSPGTGIAITGDKPGITSYTVACEVGQVVTLTAPPTITFAANIGHFACWTIDGQVASTSRTVSIAMNKDHTATAVYPIARLIIKDPVERGEPPLPAGGGKLTVDVYLSSVGPFAAMSAGLGFLNRAGENAQFLIGVVDGRLDVRVNTQAFPDPYDLSFRDVVEHGEHYSSVAFVVWEDAFISEETLAFSATYYYGPSAAGTCTIVAEPKLTLIGTPDDYSLPFATIPGHLAIALAGDVNDDCRVNILDLVFARNNLGQGSGSKADVTGDGKVNVADLVFVRERLGTKCK